MTVGFAVVSGGEGVEFRFFGSAAQRSPLITFAQQPDQAAIVMGRLYYRDDLRGLLPDPWAHAYQANDAELALAAYRHSGLEGIACLEGDFAVVIWDARGGRIVGSRDPMGGYPLFWTQHNGAIALSTGLQPLLTLLPHRALNLDYLAEFLMLPGCGVSEVSGEGCVFEEIHRVPAGTMVVVDTAIHRVDRHVYWNWLERVVDPGTDRVEEVSAGYVDLLRRAVRERLRGRTACHLSGGMDSTTVSLIARDEMRSGRGEPPLHTLSLFYEKLSVLAWETPYIDSVVSGQAGIVAHRIPGDDFLDFDVCGDPPPHDEPCPSLWRSAMNWALVDTAARAGAATILTGFGADEMLHVAPLHLTELLRRGDLRAAWHEASRWARFSKISPWRFLYHVGLINLLPAGMRPGASVWLRRGYADWPHQRQWTIPPWIVPQFVRRYALRSRAIGHIRRTFSSCRPVGLSVALASIGYNVGDAVRWSLAAPRGIHVAHPFFDPRVLRFGLGMQTRVKPEPGRRKAVLVEAMRGVLPERILNRPGKTHFNEVYFVGLARNLPALEALVRHAPVDDLHLLDKAVLLDCLQQAALGIAGDAPGTDRLTLTLALLSWLSVQAEGRPEVEPTAEVVRPAHRTDAERVRTAAGPDRGRSDSFRAEANSR